VALAFVTLMVSQLVMIGTTSTSTLYLHDQGHPVGTIGVAASLHLAGMYVSSPLSGWLSDRFGRLPMIGLGGVILMLACALAGFVPGSAGGLVIAGLFLNGIGWNLAFVSASALLTDALAPNDRTSMQGLADLCMGAMGFLGSALGGVILGVWGFGMLNAVGAAMLILPLAASSMRRAAAAARATELDPWTP
jgi:MFS family permease